MRSLVCVAILAMTSMGCSVKSISQRDFSSPEATFETWAHAARNLDLKILLDTYARSARPSIEQELARTSKEGLESMQSEAQLTNFAIEKIVYEDNLAYLRVRRKLKKDEGIEILTMVKEGDQWKLLP